MPDVMRDSGTEKNSMTKMLEAMKALVTNVLELKANAPNGVLRAYYSGELMGVLEVAASGVLSRREYEKLYVHYENERARFD